MHQSVPASPSIAFDAGLADSDEVALAWPDRAQSMVGPAPRPGSAGPGAVGGGSRLPHDLVTGSIIVEMVALVHE